MNCPRCKHEVRDSDYYCRECGLKIERCPICHAPLMPNAIYCSHCGYQVDQQHSVVHDDYSEGMKVSEKSDRIHVRKVLLISLVVYLVMLLSLGYLYFGPSVQASQPPTPTQEVTPPNAHQI